MRSAFWIIFIVVVIGVGYWLWHTGQQSGGENTSGLANPASVYCIDQGGTLDMREGAGGTQGFCVFPDGTECDEWTFFRGEGCQSKTSVTPSDGQPVINEAEAPTGGGEEAIGGDEPWENPVDRASEAIGGDEPWENPLGVIPF